MLFIITDEMDAVSLAFMISGDGTTHKHINHKSKHITLWVKDPKHDGEAIVKMLFARINTAPNHTSAEQFSGWMDLFKELSTLCKASTLG